MIGYFVNNAVPRLGEITRCGVLSRHHKVPLNSVIGTVIAERAFDMLTMLIILLITILSQIYFLGDFINQNIIYPITTKFSSSISALFVLGGSFIGLCLLFFLLYRLFLPKLRELKLFHKILDIIKGFWQGIMTIKNVKHKFSFVFYSLLMWGFYSDYLSLLSFYERYKTSCFN